MLERCEVDYVIDVLRFGVMHPALRDASTARLDRELIGVRPCRRPRLLLLLLLLFLPLLFLLCCCSCMADSIMHGCYYCCSCICFLHCR